MGRASFITEGIKLKEHLFRESDVSLLIFTESRGTIRAIAPGLKRSKKRFPGSIRKLCLYEFSLTAGKKDYYVVSGARFLQAFEEIAHNFKAYCAADYILQVIQYFYLENMASSYIYQSLRIFLESLASGKDIISTVKWMEIRVLADSGFLSNVTTCSRCARVFREEEKGYYNRENSHIYCINCRIAGKYIIISKDMRGKVAAALDPECGEFTPFPEHESGSINRITTEVILEKLGFVPRPLIQITRDLKLKGLKTL
ncbi:MAG: DNA repair protein RecO [Deltaproteobacteria bacterium]|nr:DNA repair protein RecO [Deltaproteobacteria bacterium]NIS76457.1 DNA repair protein RecO [Deltaproteobacteria bacterium]